MTLIFLQYPIVPSCFVLCAILVVLSVRRKARGLAVAVCAGAACIGMVLSALICAVPLSELLMLLLALALLGCALAPKEDAP